MPSTITIFSGPTNPQFTDEQATFFALQAATHFTSECRARCLTVAQPVIDEPARRVSVEVTEPVSADFLADVEGYSSGVAELHQLVSHETTQQ